MAEWNGLPEPKEGGWINSVPGRQPPYMVKFVSGVGYSLLSQRWKVRWEGTTQILLLPAVCHFSNSLTARKALPT